MKILGFLLLALLNVNVVVSLPCEWVGESGYKLLQHVQSGTPMTVKVASEEECKAACLTVDPYYLCAAYNYKNSVEDNCELHTESNQTATTTATDGWSYAIRPACAGIWQQWRAQRGKLIRNVDNYIIESTTQKQDRTCRETCVNNNKCRAIQKFVKSESSNKDVQCYILNASSTDSGVRLGTSLKHQYFDRPTWYSDDNEGTTNTSTTNRGPGGFSVYLMVNYKIPVDGHLVGWKYYTGRERDDACTTYATIWREENSGYRRITETQLRSHRNNIGSNFHYVHNSTAVVRRDDFLGIYVTKTATCNGTLASIGSADNPYDEVRTYDGEGAYTRPSVISSSFLLTIQSLGVSLKAYITEFIRLEDAATTHNPSLSQGQIKLTWKVPTKQNNQYQPGTGYIKVECSTDRYFSTIVDCLPNAAPIENMEIVLEQLDITQPHYARLYVVRNYNGEELEQRKSSNDFYRVNNGQPFCAERDQIPIDDVTLTENGEITPNQPITLLIATEAAREDSCIDRVTLSYSGTSKTFNNDQSKWRIQVDQGVQTTISIRYTLVDGYNISVWNGQYTTKMVPTAPVGLRVLAQSKDSVTLSWILPEYTDEFYSTTSYQVLCDVINKQYNTEVRSDSLNQTTEDHLISNLTLTSLPNQVQHNCSIRSLIDNGYGELSIPVIFWTRPQAPVYNFDEVSSTYTEETTVTLELPEITSELQTAYSTLQIVVQNASANSVENLTITDIDGVDTYITAELPVEDVSSNFTIGDNQTYGGYSNRPLQSLQEYSFYLGFKARTEDEVHEYIWLLSITTREQIFTVSQGTTKMKPTTTGTLSTTTSRITNKPTPARTDATTKDATTVAIAGSLSVVAVVVAVVIGILIYMRRRRNAKDGGSNESEVGEPTEKVPLKPIVSVEPMKPDVPDNKCSTEAPAAGNVVDNVYALPAPSKPILVADLARHISNENEANPDAPFCEEFVRVGRPEINASVGREPENIRKNKFKDITATDSNRVILSTSQFYSSDYINANYITGRNGEARFIASQGPLESTTEDMWRMIDDTNCSTIVMLTNPVENSKKKCHIYWAESKDISVVFDRFEIRLLEEQQFAEYTVRKLRYAYNNRSRDVRQFHYRQWFDQDIPSAVGLLYFKQRVLSDMETNRSPVIVHCSAGVGRTGTFIGLNLLIDEVNSQTGRAEVEVDVLRCVYGMRCQRTKMVQTKEQYAFLYEVLAEALTCGDNAVVCFRFAEKFEKWRESQDGQVSELQSLYNKILASPDICADKYYSGSTEENLARNRDPGVLAADSHRIILQRQSSGGTDYINAVQCNGYHVRRGYIVTQIPLENTVADFWNMIVEQRPTVIVSLNDTTGQPCYLPAAGGSLVVEDVKLSCKKSQEDSDGCSERVLTCQRDSKEQEVVVIEMEGSEVLPTPQQLISLCKKVEKYAVSPSDIITVQCSNGSRLSGIFVVAMNLFLRARIEQEVDIVLEVKLARRSRPQFISDYESFELLHRFVKSYIDEFCDYANI